MQLYSTVYWDRSGAC